MVEVWRDALFVAGIYGAQGGVRLVSKYLDGVVYDTGFPPAVLIKLSEKEVKNGCPLVNRNCQSSAGERSQNLTQKSSAQLDLPSERQSSALIEQGTRK